MKPLHLIIRNTPLAVLCCMPFSMLHAQLLNNDAAVYNSTAVYCDGGFTNTAASVWLNNGSLTLTGNVNNNQAAINPMNGLTTFYGTGAAQQVTGTQPFTGYDVTFSNPQGIALQQVLQVDHNAVFDTGIVSTARTGTYYPLVFGAASLQPATAHNGSHVNGVARTLWTSGNFTFPVGNDTLYRKIAAQLTTNSSGLDAQYYLADAMPLPFTPNSGGDATPLEDYFRREYWNLLPAGSATAQVTVYYDDAVETPALGNQSDLRVAHKTDAAWWNEGNSATTGTIAAGSVTSLSIGPAQWQAMTADASAPSNAGWVPFALGTINSVTTPLPVALLYFTATKQEQAVLLQWALAADNNTSRFTIQRSPDGMQWKELGSMPVSAFITPGSYAFTDGQPLQGQNLYRLKLTANNGMVSYGPVRQVYFSVAGNGRPGIAPNPASGYIYLTGVAGSCSIRIMDLSGKVVLDRYITDVSQPVDVSGLAAATYVVQLSTGNGAPVSCKLVKAKN